jgi:hypothetical protein
VSLLLECHEGHAINILTTLAEDDEYCSRILSESPPDVLIAVMRFPCTCTTALLIKLSRKATAKQLIPVFSFMLQRVQIEMTRGHLMEYAGSYSEWQIELFWNGPGDGDDDEDKVHSSTLIRDMIYSAESTATLAEVVQSTSLVYRLLSIMSFPKINRSCLQRCYGILHCLFLVRETPVIPVDSALLATWQLFFTQCPSANKDKMTLCPIVTKLVVDCSDLQLVIASGMVPSFFSRMEDQGRDGYFLQCFLDIVDHILTVRGQANREEAILFLDHFIDLGMLRSLLVSATLRATERSFNSHEFASVRKEKLKEWVKSLRMIIEFDQKYTSKLQGFIGTLGKIKK